MRPGTDGLFVGALIHELFRTQQIDLDYLIRYTNAPWLVIDAPGTADDGLIARDADGHPLAWSQDAAGLVSGTNGDLTVALTGARELADGRRARPVFELMAERYLGDKYAPESVAEATGIPADQIRRLAAEMAHVAFKEEIVPIHVPQRKKDPLVFDKDEHFRPGMTMERS